MYISVRVLDILELELQTAVSCHVGAGIEPGSSRRAASALYHLGVSPAPQSIFFIQNTSNQRNFSIQKWNRMFLKLKTNIPLFKLKKS